MRLSITFSKHYHHMGALADVHKLTDILDCDRHILKLLLSLCYSKERGSASCKITYNF